MKAKSKTRKLIEKDKLPIGGARIVEAFTTLLKKKPFGTITTAEIAEVSGVNEALIYRYFGSKRELLQIVLFYYLSDFINDLFPKVMATEGSLNKLKKVIRETIYSYQNNLVFSRILLLEVRNYPGYFQTETYQMVRKYARFIQNIIKVGIREGEIRKDVSSWVIMQIIMSGIEHLCLPTLLFKKNLQTDDLTKEFCNVLFAGIKKK